ncbi:MAG: hydroxymethylbilane synthase [Anaerolineae bacterium]|nr:hydroxymethylbilane synthase [Anaerolineae bacterium]MDW8071619.1 hydroxymethylbilane synthase [Anaerolineae bacterium]
MAHVPKMTLVLGTRPSALARRQTEWVAQLLQAAWPELTLVTRVYITRGDREAQRPLPEIGGKGLFTAEIEAALRAGEIDAAVHSLKDLPIAMAEDLVVGAVPERAPAYDVFISRHQVGLQALPPAPRIGTSSLRRAAQLRALRPDAEVINLRGNLDTRLRKAATPDYDGVVIAAAGLVRLGLEVPITHPFSYDEMLPAPAQGALAVQCRADDPAILDLLYPIHHFPTWAAVTAERAFLSGLGGGCAAPVAAYATPHATDATVLWLRGMVASLDGQRIVRVSGEGDIHRPQELGQRLAEEALARGAAELLAERDHLAARKEREPRS